MRAASSLDIPMKCWYYTHCRRRLAPVELVEPPMSDKLPVNAEPAALPADELCTALENRVLEMNGRGRVPFCFTATMDRGAYILSIVIEGVTGHYPLPERFAFGDESTMRAVADWLNEKRLNLSPETAASLVLRSMRRQDRRAGR
jgi:hypothetical protein